MLLAPAAGGYPIIAAPSCLNLYSRHERCFAGRLSLKIFLSQSLMLGCVARPSLCRLAHTKIELVIAGEKMLGRLSCRKMTTVQQRSASTTSADVVISGGGMVGTAAAATIAKLGR